MKKSHKVVKMSEDNNHENHEDRNSDTEVQKLVTRPQKIITMVNFDG